MLLKCVCHGALWTILWTLVSCQDGPPRVDGNYMASGEMVETLEDESRLPTQSAFEESFDSTNKNAAFRFYLMGKNVTFVENFETNQTFQYSEEGCTLMTVTDWVDTKSPPSLSNYEDTEGRVRFSLKQLFSLDDKYLEEKNLTSSFRGIPARKWMYELHGIDPDTKEDVLVSIYAYWSDGTWSTSSSADTAPLGFLITKLKKEKKMQVHETFINIFSFIPGAIDSKLFQAVEGAICVDRVQTLKFPDFSPLMAVALHSEFLLPDYMEAKYMDMWFDVRNKMLRMDMERIKDETIPTEVPDKSRNFQSEIVNQKLGVVFRKSYHKGLTACKVIPFENFEFDVQNLFNFKVSALNWRVEKIFGLNETKYTYIGMATKRDIPCHVFQGMRADWPDPALNVTSLWEWCFSINMTENDRVIFKSGEYGLVDVRINIIKSGDELDYPSGFQMIHHFYHVNRKDPVELDMLYYDISNCFDDSEKRALQFQVDWTITDDNYRLVENATTDVKFLQQWKSQILLNSGIHNFELRIAQVNSLVSDHKLYVKFQILEPHKELPDEIKKVQISAFAAEKNLRDNLKKKKIFILYFSKPGDKPVNLSIVEHSLNFQVNHTYEPHKLDVTTQKPQSTSTLFTLATAPDRDTSTASSETSRTTSSKASKPTESTITKATITTPINTTPHKHLDKLPNNRHGAATIAGVSIAMLLVGISIGSMVIFIKFNGLPNCVKFGG